MVGRNRLAEATSPYLLQHADNPVHWWPWSEEAFAEAADRQLPIFLSVGYAACHWCHVMAHESFEDAATAEQLNEHFVAIKVDREERPDVDAVYMAATQALSGQGGWPMSVFLTPDRQPFYAGTYFPPVPRNGMPAFRQVLAAIAEAWRDRRAEVVDSAGSIVDQLVGRRIEAVPGELDRAACAAAVERLSKEFDPVDGGFGRAPKFPPSMVLEGLLRDGGDQATTMAEQTLAAMARGGIYDQLAGGFARYSVDSHWAVPHFEKMLYDNALLLAVYAHWWRRSGDPLAERVVQETVEWLQAEMATPEGAYAASLDADSRDGAGTLREGAYYVWTPAELIRHLGGPDGAWAAKVFGVTAAGTFEQGASTLQLPRDTKPARLADVRARLAGARAGRARPGRDDKVVAAWNGLVIDGLVQAAMIFGRPEWLDAARRAADTVWDVHWQAGRLRRASRAGVAGQAPGILEDYAALMLAFTRLATATAEALWLRRAEELAAAIEKFFPDGRGGWYDAAVDAEALYVRPQDPTDNATPSGLSTAIHAFALLAELTGDDAYAERAATAARGAGGLAEKAPRFAGWLLADAISRTPGREPVQVAIVGPDGPARAALVRIAWRVAPAGSVIVAGEPDQPGFALLADRPLRDGRPTAYVCRHFLCLQPVTSVADLVVQLSPRR